MQAPASCVLGAVPAHKARPHWSKSCSGSRLAVFLLCTSFLFYHQEEEVCLLPGSVSGRSQFSIGLCGASPFRSKMNCIPEALNLVITSALLLGTTSQALPKRLFMLDRETGRAVKGLWNGCFWTRVSRSGRSWKGEENGRWSLPLPFGGGWG